MPHFGERSLRHRETLHPDLQLLVDHVIEFYDFAITEGHRSNERQAELWAIGRTEPGFKVTWVRPGESKHNAIPSDAFDFAPWPIDWQDEARFVELGGAFLMAAHDLGIEIRWGGHWPASRRDLPHIERAV